MLTLRYAMPMRAHLKFEYTLGMQLSQKVQIIYSTRDNNCRYKHERFDYRLIAIKHNQLGETSAYRFNATLHCKGKIWVPETLYAHASLTDGEKY